MHTNPQVDSLLADKKLSSTKKAAQIIKKENLVDYGPSLLETLEQIISDERHWDLAQELITVLGIINHKPALRVLEPICMANKEDDLITMRAATAYVRLSRKDLSDVEPVKKLLALKGEDVGVGALDALGYDRMVPSRDEQQKLVNICRDFTSKKPQELTDPRYGLAAACAGWDKDVVKPFLEHCLQTGDAGVRHVAQNSLKQKYVRLR